MAIEFIKVDLTDNFTKQSSPLCSLHGKIGIQMNNTVYTSKEKNYEFSSKKNLPLQNIVPHLMFIILNFIAIFYFNII